MGSVSICTTGDGGRGLRSADDAEDGQDAPVHNPMEGPTERLNYKRMMGKPEVAGSREQNA